MLQIMYTYNCLKTLCSSILSAVLFSYSNSSLRFLESGGGSVENGMDKLHYPTSLKHPEINKSSDKNSNHPSWKKHMGGWTQVAWRDHCTPPLTHDPRGLLSNDNSWV